MGGSVPRSLCIYVYTKQGGGQRGSVCRESLLGRFPCEWHAVLRSMSVGCGLSAG
jgi:hypothetical protein